MTRVAGKPKTGIAYDKLPFRLSISIKLAAVFASMQACKAERLAGRVCWLQVFCAWSVLVRSVVQECLWLCARVLRDVLEDIVLQKRLTFMTVCVLL